MATQGERARRVAVALLAVLGLSACGGGAGDATAGTPTPLAPSATPSAASEGPRSVRPTDRVTIDGVGPVRIGMTYAQLEVALGAPVLINDYLGNGGACVVLRPARDVTAGLRVIGGNGVVTDISVSSGGRKTGSGVRLGDPEARIGKVYGKNAKLEPTTSGGKVLRWFVVRRQGSPNEVSMLVTGGRVSQIAVGLASATPGVRGGCT